MHKEGDRMKVQFQYHTDLGMLYIVQEDDAIAEVGILQPNQIIPYEKKETSLIQFSGRTTSLSITFSAERNSISTKGVEYVANDSVW